jgi:hypothetical protein
MVIVYGRCKGLERDNFIQWLYNLVIHVDSLWLLLGDFNFIRSTKNINKSGGAILMICLCSMILLDIWDSLSYLLKEGYILGQMCKMILCSSNLTSFFLTPAWITKFPNTVVLPMAKSSSDHVPC